MVGDFLKGVAILSTKTENPIRRPYPLQEVSLSFKKDWFERQGPMKLPW